MVVMSPSILEYNDPTSYIQMFDSGRDALSLAYTSNATFSLTDDST